MKIEYYVTERLGASGSSLINSIQNTSTATLDLLVREAIQNSLDASDKSKSDVRVNIEVKEFQSDKLSQYLEGIESNLNARYGSSNQDLLLIRDSNTVGLTGPLRTKGLELKDFGNFYKLVYDIDNKQQQECAGGAWGIGKTIYFRLGVGIVLYYSRIKEKGIYEERLAGCIVEDEENKTSHLLPKLQNDTNRGIAWWGANADGNHLSIPLTNVHEIHSILDDIGVKPYSGEDTGTTIIIPYLNTRKLLGELKHADNSIDAPSWCDSKPVSKNSYDNRNALVRYLGIAARRWYAPRMNDLYQGKRLNLTINGQYISCRDSIFELVQKLYNARPDLKSTYNGVEIISKPISIRETFVDSAIAGWVNFVRIKDEYLNGISPYYYFFNYKDPEITDLNSPIIMYARQPGMIVNYELGGNWLKSVPDTELDEYIIAFFVPDSKQVLSSRRMFFDEYLRKGEKADHMGWSDITEFGNLRIVDRIQKNVSSNIKKELTDTGPEPLLGHEINWGRSLTSRLMPPEGLANWDSGEGGTTAVGGCSGNGRTQNRNITTGKVRKQFGIKPEGVKFENDCITLKAKINMGSEKMALLGIDVLSESGNLSYTKWEKQLSTEFPIDMLSFKVTKLEKIVGSGVVVLNDQEVVIDRDQTINDINFTFVKSSIGAHNVALQIELSSLKGIIIDCEIKYTLDNVKGSVFLKAVEEEK